MARPPKAARPTSFRFDAQTQAQLDALARHDGATRVQVMTRLIRREHGRLVGAGQLAPAKEEDA